MASCPANLRLRDSAGQRFLRLLLILLALLFVTVFLLIPLGAVFIFAFQKGLTVYRQALVDPYTLSAIKLTLITALFAIPLNLIFGLAAAWCLARFRFKGRNLLLTLIDLPLAVSPVIAGMTFTLLYGSRGFLAPVFRSIYEEFGLDIKIIFAPPGIVLATTFVTLPYIVRELLPIMQRQGSSEEEAALTMGASGWQMFRGVTLPNVKWGLIYGLVLCNARAMGEFGAVSVVSGHIRGATNTLPLHIEILYNEYNLAAAFAAASLLTLLALVTLLAKSLIEWRELRHGRSQGNRV